METKTIQTKKRATKPDQSKRSFMAVFACFIGSLIGIAVTFPIIGFLFHPLRKKTVYGGLDFIKVGNIKDVKGSAPRKAVIKSFKTDGWNRFDNIILGAVWLIREGDNKIIAFSSVCPHLGCGIDWSQKKEQFVCPCHASIFDINGHVLSGPSPRQMDRLDTKVENGEILVKYRKLRLGSSNRIEV